jgi:hypothetical protein
VAMAMMHPEFAFANIHSLNSLFVYFEFLIYAIFSYQFVMSTWGEEQSSDQSLNESLLPLLQKVVGLPRGPMRLENLGLWQLDQAVEVCFFVLFFRLRLKVKHLGVYSNSPSFSQILSPHYG